MTGASGPHAAGHYELRLEGYLDEHWSTWFEALTLTHDDETTILRGVVSDQAELHGLLVKVRDLGATLISLRLVELGPDSQAPQRCWPRAPPSAILSSRRQQHPATSEEASDAKPQE